MKTRPQERRANCKVPGTFQCFSEYEFYRFTEMVHILAASSLHHAVNSLPYSSKKQFLGKVKSVQDSPITETPKTGSETQEISRRVI